MDLSLLNSKTKINFTVGTRAINKTVNFLNYCDLKEGQRYTYQNIHPVLFALPLGVLKCYPY